MRVARPEEKLDDFINNFVAAYPDRNKYHFSSIYPDMISFELKDENMYQDIGGAHMQMIGIKRERPKYAGLLLEQAITLPKGESENMTIYRIRDSKDRFDGQIFYAVMLDACEDIYDEAFQLFKELFEEQIIIE